MRKEDILARLGGDEFAISMKEIIKTEDAEILAQKLLSILREPFSLGGAKVGVTASIGIAVYPGAGETAAQLTQSADKAMYQAKKTGRNNFQFYKS